MTLKPKYHLETVKALEETPITNQSRYRVRSLPAAGRPAAGGGLRGAADGSAGLNQIEKE